MVQRIQANRVAKNWMGVVTTGDGKKLKIAFHEAGHVVMAMLCRQGIKKVSLGEMDSPKGTRKYLGSTTLQPFEQNETVNRQI